MSSKAQIQHLFAYLSAIVVIIALIFLGVRTVSFILSKSCEVQKKNFVSDLENLISEDKIFGSSHHEALKAPCKFSKVCFVDSSPGPSFSCDNKLVERLVKRGVKSNVFLVSKRSVEDVGRFESLGTSDVNKCVCVGSSSGFFKFDVKGFKGKAVVK